MPAAGDWFIVGSKRYEVVDMDRNRVDKILVSDVPPPEESGEEG
jgi:CBS domain containing-hemolysin-like protein